MKKYLDSVSNQKKKLTMANIPMLDKYGIIPKEFDFERRIFNYNRYLKNKVGDYYEIDGIGFYEENFSIDHLVSKDDKNFIPQKSWDKLYAAKTERLKNHLKNDSTILERLNEILYQEVFR